MKFSTALWRVFHALKYRIYAGHRKGHRIHAPFAFKLVNQVIHSHDPKPAGMYSKSELALPERKIAIPAKYGELLFRLLQFLKPEKVVELGTGNGYSTMFLAKARPGKPVLTVDQSAARFATASQLIQNHKICNVRFFVKNFAEFLNQELEIEEKNLFIFLDGDHRYEAVIKYTQRILDTTPVALAILLDDINWSRDLYKAFRELAGHPRISLSMELNRMGLLMSRGGLYKQHYRVVF